MGRLLPYLLQAPDWLLLTDVHHKGCRVMAVFTSGYCLNLTRPAAASSWGAPSEEQTQLSFLLLRLLIPCCSSGLEGP